MLCIIAGQKAAAATGPAHLNSAAGAREAIRLMEADKRAKEAKSDFTSLRAPSKDREVRPRDRAERLRWAYTASYFVLCMLRVTKLGVLYYVDLLCCLASFIYTCGMH